MAFIIPFVTPGAMSTYDPNDPRHHFITTRWNELVKCSRGVAHDFNVGLTGDVSTGITSCIADQVDEYAISMERDDPRLARSAYYKNLEKALIAGATQRGIPVKSRYTCNDIMLAITGIDRACGSRTARGSRRS